MLVLSETNLEFGNIDPGQSADRSFEIRNDGDMTLGIGTLEIGENSMVSGNGEANFTLSYDIERMICPEGISDSAATDAEANAKSNARCAALPAEMKERPNYVDRLSMQEDAMKARVASIEAVKPTLTALYAVLSPEQKAILDKPRMAGGPGGREMHKHGGPR